MEVWAVILAGGSGKRFGGVKQFQKIMGKTLYTMPLEVMVSLKEVKGAAVVVPEDHLERVKEELNAMERIIVVPGGKTRRDSSKNGVGSLPPSATHVLIHDAARPNLKAHLVKRVIDRLYEGEDAVIPVVPSHDALKVVKDGYVVKTLNRKEIFRAQTPQGFKRPIIQEVLEDPRSPEDVFDDAQLLEAKGIRIRVVEGDPLNIKITTREDLSLFLSMIRLTEADILDN